MMHHINASFNDRQMERLNEISSCLGINKQAVIRLLLTYYCEQVIGDDDDDDDYADDDENLTMKIIGCDTKKTRLNRVSTAISKP